MYFNDSLSAAKQADTEKLFNCIKGRSGSRNPYWLYHCKYTKKEKKRETLQKNI